jgi:signal transduction histidine kinase
MQARTLEKQKRALETAQAELRAANEDLTVRARDHERMSIAEREANRAKSDFLASMSHELRTPLNAISGYVELLELGIRGPLTIAQREDLSRIRRSQQALLSLINDILNFTKLEAGEVRFHIKPVIISDVIAAVEPMIRPQAEAKWIAYQTDSEGLAVTALADPERLAQVILNLLSNAVKYTDSGGAIVVSTRKTPTDALVSIRDTGCGIPEQRLTDIFDPFVQVESLPSTRQSGVGLGVAISRDIARAMKGNVTAQSEVGRGSEFTVSLPRADLQAGLDRVAGT